MPSPRLFLTAALLVALSVTLPVTLMGCNSVDEPVGMLPAVDQAGLENLASHLTVNYHVIDNRPDGHCSAAAGAGSCYIAELTLRASADMGKTGWSLYFSQVDPVVDAVSDEFLVEHINGDLHRLSPIPQFTGFSSGETKTIKLISGGLVLSESKLMPNYYVVAEGLEPEVIESTRVSRNPETGMEIRPYVTPLTDPEQFKSDPEDQTQWATSSRLYEDNADVSLAPAKVDTVIIPTPFEVIPGAGRLELAKGLNVSLSGIEKAALEPALDRLALLGIEQSNRGVPVAISVDEDAEGEAESYRLDITESGISATAADSAGALYALQSVAALIVPGQTAVPAMTVIDYPRYSFRGLHIDVARNFHSKDLLLKIMDQMAAYKLNKLHLHLGDDEGWRLEVKGLPELTDIGSKRCHDLTETRCLLPQLGSGPHGNTQVDGYYTIEEYQEILRAASARNIQVIPSFDMPGHSRAVIKAMEARYRHYMAQGNEEEARKYLLSDFDDTTVYDSIQHYNDNTINVCMESTYRFIDKVMDEMKAVHAAAGQPLTLYHIGADETAGAWVESPVCKQFLADNNYGIESVDELGAYFIERVARLLAEKDIETAGWSDGMGETNPGNMPKVQSNLWSLLGSDAHHVAHEQLSHGWDLVLSVPDVLYLDFPQAADPKEHGYYWGSRETTVRDVFNFMPDNLPVHAEFRTNPSGQTFTSDDRVQRDEQGNITHQPRKKGTEIAGIQGQVWSETLRSDRLVEYMLFPRMVALAERAWHKPEWALPYDYEGALYNSSTNAFTDEMQMQRDAEWNQFANAIAQKVMPKLDLAGIQYRLPTVGAEVENGVLKANVSFPGLAIEYRVDGGTWQTYEGPVEVKSDAIEVRSVAPDGKRRGRSIPVT